MFTNTSAQGERSASLLDPERKAQFWEGNISGDREAPLLPVNVRVNNFIRFQTKTVIAITACRRQQNNSPIPYRIDMLEGICTHEQEPVSCKKTGFFHINIV
jgi:hypothetical protein